MMYVSCIMEPRFIIMGDVIGSRGRRGSEVMAQFEPIVAHAQEVLAERILSPLTITLGDEFQGVVADHRALIAVIFECEMERLRRGGAVALRYSAAVGPIETPINTETAHGMLGPALITARERLSDKSKARRRFSFDLQRADQSAMLEALFSVMARRLDGWSADESGYIADLLCGLDAGEAARLHDRDVTTVRRRRKSAPVQDFLDLRAAVEAAARLFDAEAD